MKRKMIVTMSVAFWMDDSDFEVKPNDDQDAINQVLSWDEDDIIDQATQDGEITTTKVEVTETKNGN